jgi:hypothetical protein
MWKEPFMSRRAEISEALAEVLHEVARRLALDTGCIKRVCRVDGADGAHRLIFGWWQEPEVTGEGLRQVLGRRQGEITSSGLSHRFAPEAAACFRWVLEE